MDFQSECLEGFNDDEFLRGGSVLVSVSEALVLDNERGELVKATATTGGGRRNGGKEGVLSNKSVVALKNHREAERRRRERINAHLATLRGLVPCTDAKMDKAAILAHVVTQVKELKKKASEASKGFLIPADTDDVRVELLTNGSKDGNFFFRASLCCAYRPELISDLKQAIDALHLNTTKAEMSTLDGRVLNVFIFTSYGREKGDDGVMTCEALADTIRQALCSVMDKGSTCLEYSPRTALLSKRQRISYLDSSSSSS